MHKASYEIVIRFEVSRKLADETEIEMCNSPIVRDHIFPVIEKMTAEAFQNMGRVLYPYIYQDMETLEQAVSLNGEQVWAESGDGKLKWLK